MLTLQKKDMENILLPAPPPTVDENAHHHHKDKTDPRFVCEVHGVPAVRRRCSHGIHKDRRFYVCGLERRERCNYFKWSSDVPELSPGAAGGLLESQENVFSSVQAELQKVFSEKELQKGFW